MEESYSHQIYTGYSFTIMKVFTTWISLIGLKFLYRAIFKTASRPEKGFRQKTSSNLFSLKFLLQFGNYISWIVIEFQISILDLDP